MSETIIGFDVGGSKIAVVEGGYDATIYQRTTLPVHVGKPVAETFDAMCAAAAVVGLLVLLVGLWRERRRRIAEEKRFAMDPVRRFRP